MKMRYFRVIETIASQIVSSLDQNQFKMPTLTLFDMFSHLKYINYKILLICKASKLKYGKKVNEKIGSFSISNSHNQ